MPTENDNKKALRAVHTQKARVKRILEDSPETRDNYNKLLSFVWNEDLIKIGVDPTKVSGIVVLAHLSTNKLTKQGSITRARRDIQAEHVHLRGADYGMRKDQEKGFRDGINKPD